MFKDLFKSGKCLLGFHQGTWEYEKPDKCTKFRVCTHCAKRSTKTEHTWSAWKYHADDDCQQIRICTRCGEKEEQTVHIWGKEAFYKKDNDCSTVNYCERCHAEKPYKVIHVWDEWVYSHTNRCDQKQKCVRCGTLGGEERIQHSWEGWQHSPFYKARVIVCRHCGLMPLNFDNTTTYTMTMQDVDNLYGDLIHSNSVRQIVSAIRENKSCFVQPFNPVMKSYQDFVQAHMPDGNNKESYKSMADVIRLISETGVETVLAYLNDVQYQTTNNPWKLVLSKLAEANAYTRRMANLDKGLIGHWMHNKVLGEFSVSTDYHKIFKNDGSYAEYYYSVSGVMDFKKTSETTRGIWWSENNLIHIELESGGIREIYYQFSDSYLVLDVGGTGQFWERAS